LREWVVFPMLEWRAAFESSHAMSGNLCEMVLGLD
jgi:hypothetical protein